MDDLTELCKAIVVMAQNSAPLTAIIGDPPMFFLNKAPSGVSYPYVVFKPELMHKEEFGKHVTDGNIYFFLNSNKSSVTEVMGLYVVVTALFDSCESTISVTNWNTSIFHRIDSGYTDLGNINEDDQSEHEFLVPYRIRMEKNK